MSLKGLLVADPDRTSTTAFQEALGPDWEIVGVDTGQAALAAMKKEARPVLVANLTLPDCGGDQLLNQVRRKYPSTVRFILTSDETGAHAMKQVLGAHQILTKPISRLALRETVERALDLGTWIANASVRQLVSRVRAFPTMPTLYLEILTALKSPSASPEDVGNLIAKDFAITTKLLQVLNSALFGLPRRITDPGEAVGILGFEAVKSMVLAVKLLGQYDRVKPAYFSIDRLWRHSTQVAQVARKLARLEAADAGVADLAFAAGLMHDVGKAVLAANFEQQYRGAQDLARQQSLPLYQVEQQIFGATHAEIGAYLMGLWGMPLELIETTAFHHSPAQSSHQGFTPLTAVHIANVFAHELSADAEEIQPKIDETYLNRIELSERLPIWRDSIFDARPEEVEASEGVTHAVQAHIDSPSSSGVKSKVETTPCIDMARSKRSEMRPRLLGALLLAATLIVLGLVLALTR